MITAIFDGNCVICQSTRRTMLMLDWLKRVEFLNLHDHDLVRERFPQLNQADLMGEIHVIADGTVYAGFMGTRRMLKEVPIGFPLWLILQLPGMNWLGPKIYGFIARNRYAVNRFFGVELEDSCVDGVCKIPR